MIGGGQKGGGPGAAPSSARRGLSAPPPPPATITAAITTPAPSSTSAPTSTPAAKTPDQPSQRKEDVSVVVVAAKPTTEVAVDYTKIPAQLEKKMEQLDVDGALRPTIIKASNSWSKKFQKALLAAAESSSLGTDEQGKERNKTFDLLDALSKSGALSVDYASLHVVIASTHCFAKSLMNTVIQDNINPIEKLERSSLIVASTIHRQAPLDLVADEQVARVGTYSPMLIEQGAAGGKGKQSLLPVVAAAATSSVKK